MSEALFRYKIRISPRAKQPSLRITVQHGLEIVVPKGYDKAKVPAVLDRKRNWIKAALERMELHRKLFISEAEQPLPTSITLPAIGQTWQIEWRTSPFTAAAGRKTTSDRLIVFCKAGDQKARITALQRRLQCCAADCLIPLLHKMSEKTGLHFSRVLIKRQKTRWASCSRKRSISLNAKLMFLTPDLVEYILIHELCHLEEMNHSKKFWSLVQSHLPGYKALDSRLKDAWKELPAWVH